jgi:hypothetical protein
VVVKTASATLLAVVVNVNERMLDACFGRFSSIQTAGTCGMKALSALPAISGSVEQFLRLDIARILRLSSTP